MVQSMTTNAVIASLADPYQLEVLYQAEQSAFTEQLNQALQEHPQAQILKFWQARIEFAQQANKSSQDLQPLLLRLVLLCLAAALFMKLPAIFTIGNEWYYTRFTPVIVISALIMFYALQYRLSSTLSRIIVGGIVIITALMLLLPEEQTASIVMSILHAPLVMWSLLGLAFTSSRWKSATARLDYLRYNGELFIFTVLILLGGAVLTGLTLGLFSLLGLNIETWYAEYIIIPGVASAPIVATFLYENMLHRRSRLATLIANVFTPLFLVMVTVYLIAMAVQQQSPYTDRNFLILINGLLLLVLAMTIFSIAGRNNSKPSRLADAVNLGLIAVTLVVNLVALSAIVYRLAEWGLTPNRVVVTGANLLIFMHLITITVSYFEVLRDQTEAEKLTQAITRMLPVYCMWSIFIMIGLPLLFRFQ